MLNEIKGAEGYVYRHQQNDIPVAFSFSAYTEPHHWQGSTKVWLDILFVHPESNAPASVRVAKSNRILCQPKEVVEAIVHRELKSFLSQPLSAYGYV